MLSEITDSTNQGKAFPMLSATWSVGCVIGPIIGGQLSDPAKRYPTVFGQYEILHQYPYLLPCAVSCLITTVSVIACVLFVDETLPSKVAARTKSLHEIKAPVTPTTSYGSASITSTLSEDSAENSTRAPTPPPPAPKMGMMELLASPQVRAILASTFMLSILGMGFEVVFVLYSYTRIDLGGLGRSPIQIGYALAASGFVGTAISLIVFPALQQRFHNRRMYTLLMGLWGVTFCLMPLGNWVMRLDPTPAMAWVGIAVILTPVRLAVLNFPLNMILVRASAPNPDLLGAMFGLQQTLASTGRAISPAFVSSLFAISIEKRLLGGNLVWVVMIALGFVGMHVSSKVVNVPSAREAERLSREAEADRQTR